MVHVDCQDAWMMATVVPGMDVLIFNASLKVALMPVFARQISSASKIPVCLNRAQPALVRVVGPVYLVDVNRHGVRPGSLVAARVVWSRNVSRSLVITMNNVRVMPCVWVLYAQVHQCVHQRVQRR